MDIKSGKDKIKISLSWSGGKDSAFALWHLLQSGEFEVVRLHTVFGEETKRVGLHGIPEELIDKQADCIGLPLDKLYYPASGDNRAYENAIKGYLYNLEALNISHIAYGDIFLEDLKKYREDLLESNGFHAVFPLWEKDTRQLAEDFIAFGFETLICAADADKIDPYWLGRKFEMEFLNSLPKEVDPCGENGEFHSFCINGPVFGRSLEVNIGEKISKSYLLNKDDGTQMEKKFGFIEMT
ncbi:diphthine--ammonia ligase [Aquiflexum sp.]|uniref:Dph6-related ATP pyrophosphatase n=1 Tax=Aquiflexum sp. TaxID=1872584 RepID=UPI003593F624